MESRINFNKKVKMHNVCAKSSEIDSYIDCICFQNGFAYATNRVLLVANKIDEICNFDIEQQKLLDGKAISADNYKKILEYECAVVSEDGVECVDVKKGKSFFYFYEPKEDIETKEKKQMPNFESVFKAEKQKIISTADKFGLNLDNLCRIKNAIYDEGNGVYIQYYENAAVIKPINEFCSSYAMIIKIYQGT